MHRMLSQAQPYRIATEPTRFRSTARPSGRRLASQNRQGYYCTMKVRALLAVSCAVLTVACGGATQLGPGSEEGESGAGSQASAPSAQGGTGSTGMTGGTGPGSNTKGGGDAGPSTDLPTPDEASALCGVPGGSTDPLSAEAIETLLVGQWLYCSGSVFFGVNHVALELAADGQFYFLTKGDDGGLVRLGGPYSEGSWKVTDLNGTFVTAMGSNYPSFAFQTNPLAFRMIWPPGGMADYVAIRSP